MVLIILGSRLKTVHSFGMVILEVEKVTTSDAGKYSCTAKNPFGEATSTVILSCAEKGIIKQAPKFTSHLIVSLKWNSMLQIFTFQLFQIREDE